MKVVGLIAEFSGPDELLAATRQLRAAGYGRLEAYTPFPVEGLVEVLGDYRDRIPAITLLGGVLGGLGGYLLQWYSATIDYPLDIGGRPLHSWPAFIPVTFELAVLGAVLFAVFGMLASNGLPKLHDPLFDVPEFDCASRDRFFLYIPRASAPHGRNETQRQLQDLDSLLIKAVRA